MKTGLYSPFIVLALLFSVMIASASPIFNDDFETGDTSAWTSSSVESGNTLAITSAAAFEGAYGMSVTTGTSNDDARVNKQIPATSDIYTRVMLKLNSNMGNGNHKSLLTVAGNPESSPMGIFGIRTKANYVNRAFTWAAGSWASASNFDFDTNKWYCVETQFVRSSTNGAIRVWVDGVQVANRQGLNTGSVDPTYLRLGSDSSTVSSNFYMDNFKSDTTRIGCGSDLPPDSCGDTDGGNVIGTSGTASGYLNGSAYSNSDSCVDSSNVNEYFCSGNYQTSQQQSCGTDGYEGSNYCSGNDIYRNYSDYGCGSGACSSTTTPTLQETCANGCTNGTCNLPPDSCGDTDGGINLLTAGTVSGYSGGNSYSNSDYCVDTSNVNEYYCSGSQAANTQASCGTDTSVNYCANGDVYTNNTDYSCSTGACSSTFSSTLTEDCQYGCTNGTCDLAPADSCSDTDGGNVTTVAGTTSGYLAGNPYSNSDYCVDADWVNEYYCNGNYQESQQDYCGSDGYYSSNYCQSGNVYRNYSDYGCGSGACSLTVTPTLQQTCANGCTGGTCDLAPADLIVSDLTFLEYDPMSNGSVYVNITATIKNVGEVTATGPFTSRLSGIWTSYKTTSILIPQATTTINLGYGCSMNHTVSSYTDIYNNIAEGNEGNNYAETYIDCII